MITGRRPTGDAATGPASPALPIARNTALLSAALAAHSAMLQLSAAVAGGPARPVDPALEDIMSIRRSSQRTPVPPQDEAERMIRANGVDLCAQGFGDRDHPAILLVTGVGSSMLWWEEGLCRMLADRGRFVLRYDHRDTGRSVTYQPGRPGYTGADLVADAAGVLDAYGIAAAHVVGVSAGGAFAQLLALGFADRVLSLVLVSTSPATPGDRGLPPPTEAFARFVTSVEVDWSDPASVVEYLVGYSRLLAGGRRPFDEAAARELAHRDVERAHDFAAARNHDVIPEGRQPRQTLSEITAPTLVIHGTADPMFPLEHGRALAREIPGARLLKLEEAGHGIDRADWDTVVHAIAEHTAG